MPQRLVQDILQLQLGVLPEELEPAGDVVAPFVGDPWGLGVRTGLYGGS